MTSRHNLLCPGASILALLGIASMLSAAPRHRVIHENVRASSNAPTGQAHRLTWSGARGIFGKLPLSFEPNFGQSDPQVRYLSHGDGFSLLLTQTEAILLLKPANSRSNSGRSDMLRMRLLGSNTRPQIEGQSPTGGQTNYFIGRDPAHWHPNIPNYSKVRYTGVYPGVDVVYYGRGRQLEHDFIVAPGADPRAISLAMDATAGSSGADGNKKGRLERLQVKADGSLEIATSNGVVNLLKPNIYQEVNGVRRPVSGGYALQGRSRVGFRVAAYNHQLPLIIDPVFAILTNASYLGGTMPNSAGGVSIGPAGNVYITGSTQSSDIFLPPPPGGVSGALSVPPDAFVAKLNPTLSTLLYATYIGGSGTDTANAIVEDAGGTAYITGTTNSADFPTTPATAFQPTSKALRPLDPTDTSAFVTTLSPGTGVLAYSTYLGGAGPDTGNGIAVDRTGAIYVTGSTASADFPFVLGVQAAINVPPVAGGGAGTGGAPPATAPFTDAFVTKIDPTIAGATAAVYSTFLGGTGNDSGSAIVVDNQNRAFITGTTASLDFPTHNAAQQARAGDKDAFIARINFNGVTNATLGFSTYLGGTRADTGNAIALDTLDSEVFIVGNTLSTDLPVAGGAAQSASGDSPFAPVGDGFVAGYSLNGALRYASYLGGSAIDTATGVAVDSKGFVYVTGATQSDDFPTLNPFEPTLNNGAGTGGFGATGDAYIVRLDAAGGTGVSYSSFLGGSNDDAGVGIAVNTAGIPYVVGNTSSRDFPKTTGGHQPAFRGTQDLFIARIDHGPEAPTALVATAVSQTEIDLTFTDTTADATSFQIQRKGPTGNFATIANIPATGPATTFTYKDTNLPAGLTPNTTYTYQVVAINAISPSLPSATATATTLRNQPLAPTLISATAVSSSEVDLVFSDANNDQTGFIIERAPSGPGGPTAAFTTISPALDAGSTTYQDIISPPTPLTSYAYRVTATNPSGFGPTHPSNIITVTTPVNTPLAPTNLTYTPTSTSQVLLQFVDNSGGVNITGFKVEQIVGTGAPTLVTTLPVTTTSVAISNLAQGTVYNFFVVATNSPAGAAGTNLARDSSPSNIVNAITQPNPPAAPTNLQLLAASTTEIDLSYTSNSTNETGFDIERAIGTSDFSRINGVPAGVTTFADTSVVAGVTYRYRVRAVNSGGPSDYSNVAVLTAPLTAPLAPTAPTNLVAKVTSSTQATLSFTDNSSNETGFAVERSTGVGSFIRITTLGPNITSFVDTGLSSNVAYVYQVRSLNGASASTPSNTASVIIGGNSISGLVVTPAGGTNYPVPGLTVQLQGPTGTTLTVNATTDSAGRYTFNNVADGSYAAVVTPVGQTSVSVAAAVGGTNGSSVTAPTISISPLAVFPAGLSMIAIPYTYTTQDIGQIIGTNLIATYADVSTTSADGYLYYPNLPGPSGKLTVPGRGYWIKETSPTPFLTAGSPVTSPFDLTLQPGWNQIGDPYTAPIDINQVQFIVPFAVGTTPANTLMSYQTALTNFIVRSPVFQFSSTALQAGQQPYSATTTLQPFAGCWIYVDPTVSKNTPITIHFTNPNS